MSVCVFVSVSVSVFVPVPVPVSVSVCVFVCLCVCVFVSACVLRLCSHWLCARKEQPHTFFEIHSPGIFATSLAVSDK